MSSYSCGESDRRLCFMARMGISERIKEARKARGMSQGELARKLGLKRASVSQWESGATTPESHRMPRIAEILEVKYFWLTDGEGSMHLAGLPVIGKVAAGAWREPVMTSDDQYFVPISPDPDYPADAQFALIVEGTSVNIIASDGEILHCIDLIKGGLTPRNGDLVVVERLDAGKIETTVKRLRHSNGTWQLYPESTDGQFQTVIKYDDRRADEVRIRAIVIGHYGTVERGR